MRRLTNTLVTVLLAATAAGGCATTGKPPVESDGDEAKSEAAPKPPSDAQLQQQRQKQQQKTAQVSASARADFEGAVKKWDAAKALSAKSGMSRSDCKSLADNFTSIHDAQLAAQTHFNAGTILESCGLEKEAESEYQAALSTNPGYGPALNNLGELYYKQNNPSTARSWFEKAIAADPTHNAPAYNNLAALLFQQGKQAGDSSAYKGAISNLRRALAIDSYSMPAYALLALIYYTTAENDKAKLQLAELVCKQAKETDDKYAPIYNTLGLIQLRRKNPTLALKEFEQAISLDPRYIEAHLNIGAIGLSTRQYDKAEASFAAVLKLDAKNLDATIGMGVASRGLKKVDEAEKWYKKAAELDPRNCAVQYNLGVLYQDYKSDPANGNLNSAKDYFSKYRSCGTTDSKKVQDADRRIKDIEDTFAALEQQKRMEADLKVQQQEMERQQKAMEEQQKAHEAAPAAGAKAPTKSDE